MFQKTYILNGILIFWPERNLLSDGKNETRSIQLTGPASRCLELLLTRMDLVFQNELYEYGWAGSGFIPSPNTLYQSISVLRRAFRELDESGVNYILTETRRGFRINPEVTVSPEQRTSGIKAASDSSSPEAGTDLGSGDDRTTDVKQFHFFMLICAIVGLTFTTFLILHLTSDSFLFKTVSFGNYKKQTSPDITECSFFLSPYSSNFQLSQIDPALLTCNKNPFNYITTYSYSSNVSVISCNKEINSSPDACRVLNLRGKNEH
ncbi:winged helix-turn-helix domain-containing protein [Klebsiella sp. I138]|uniref:winged helix-turn-helix domain-containing protein n=1 Tax=Klebsiella sp. I138 TaxID=2755385 RepID=UPI003DAA0E1E